MTNRILIALDGTPHSNAALELGIRWHRKFGASLAGLGVVDEPSVRKPEPVSLGATHYKLKVEEKRLLEARDRVNAILEEFERRCMREGVPFDVLEGVGSPHEQILAEAQRFDLLLLGQETRFQFATREGPDSTLKKVLRHSPRPVIVVPQRLPLGESVLVAYDGSLQASRALQAFQWFHGSDREPVHVLSVGRSLREARVMGQGAVDFLLSHRLPSVAVPLVSPERIASAIIRTAGDIQAGLIVMGAYGKPRLREFLLGSVTRFMLRHSPYPLFLYH